MKRRWNYALDEDAKIVMAKATDVCVGSDCGRCRGTLPREDDAWALSAKSLYEVKERVKQEFGGKWNSWHSMWVIRAGTKEEAERMRDSLQADIDRAVQEYRTKWQATKDGPKDARRSQAAKRGHVTRRKNYALNHGYCASPECTLGRACKDPTHYTTTD